MIMNVRNRWSNSGPRAWSSCASCSSVSMPGISIGMSIPGHHAAMDLVRVGNGLIPFAEPALHRRDFISLRDGDALAQELRRPSRAPCVGAHPAMTTACAWWPIIPVMNSTSAFEKGGIPWLALASSAGDIARWSPLGRLPPATGACVVAQAAAVQTARAAKWSCQRGPGLRTLTALLKSCGEDTPSRSGNANRTRPARADTG